MKITVKTDHDININCCPMTIVTSLEERDQTVKLFKVLQSSVNLAAEENKALESAIYTIKSLAPIVQQLERFQAALTELMAYFVGLQHELIFATRLVETGGES